MRSTSLEVFMDIILSVRYRRDSEVCGGNTDTETISNKNLTSIIIITTRSKQLSTRGKLKTVEDYFPSINMSHSDRSGRASNSVNVKATDNYDYVEGDVSRVSGDMSLYQCEMPEEKIRRLKAKRDSMSRLKDLPLGVKSCYPTVNTRF